VPSIRPFVRRSGRLTALARGVREAIRGVPSSTTVAPGRRAAAAPVPGIEGVAELHRVSLRRAPPDERGPRLNLFIPTLSANRAFGGTRTALDLFDALAPHFPRHRIVAFQPIPDAALATLDGFGRANPGDERPPDQAAVALPRDSEATLAVGPDDAFLATFWTTAELATRICRWQRATYEGHEPRPFAYLVQDFEPGFYAWSAQSELARATYAAGVATIGVVNSSLLAEYLASQGIVFEGQFTFEPRIDARLRPLLAEPPRERTRRLVAYGRPDTPRNAFPLVVDALRAWVAAGGGGGWEVVSAGRPHPPVELGRGLRMRALGKLELEAYGALLRESAVGLSLMVSPHPSYPPLDMAHLGMRVVTNAFGPKELSAWHENIVSAASLTAAGVADAIATQVAAFETDPAGGDGGAARRPDYVAEGPLFPFADTLAERLGARL
jgi:beta-1,2-rhamnosyltransferase WsaF-like protein